MRIEGIVTVTTTIELKKVLLFMMMNDDFDDKDGYDAVHSWSLNVVTATAILFDLFVFLSSSAMWRRSGVTIKVFSLSLSFHPADGCSALQRRGKERNAR